MTTATMIERAVTKGYNRQAAEELLAEIYATSYTQQTLIKGLLHFNFITLRQAEKAVA